MPLRRIALLTIFAFGCATVRVPVSSATEPADAPGVIASPIVDLWIESSEQVSAEEAAKADAQARAALARALGGRDISANAAGAIDAVLFVRERAVATTEARQSQQAWAKVGIVVGIVLVVAAVVILAVASKGSSHSTPSTKTAKATGPKRSGPPVAVKPRANPATPPVATPRLAPGPRPAPVVPAAVPAYGRSRSPIYLGFDVDFWIRSGPLVLAPEEPPLPLSSSNAPPFEDDSPLFEAGPPPPPDLETIADVALELPPLSPTVNFDVEDRSFFAGPQTALQLDLIDRATGQLLWSKAVKREADPLDTGDMAKLLDEALKDVSWAPRRR